MVGIARTKRSLSDTSIVVVVAPPANVVRLVVSPDTATVSEGQTVAFSAAGKLSDSSTTPVGVSWTATGGAIDPSGSFKAGTTPGHYHMIAKNAAGTLADTSSVTVPTPPAPTPTLSQVILTPATASLTAGGSQQFVAYRA